ncbi:MAG TPA: sigma-70 family RNA polymerase sigma factor [Phycisphaerales bacterium]|nr:sigma-70 family RNA polymerase sigma factor [Phycisphaerales bacterium]
MDSDQALIQAATQGNERAWAALVGRYRRLVYFVPHSQGLPPEGCDDVFQSTFLALVRNLHTLRDAQALSKWLVTTATRECWKWTRHHRWESAAPAGMPTDGAADELVERAELQAKIRGALDTLGGRCEQLLKALYLARQPVSYDEISQRLGIPVGSIGPTRNRCLAKLLMILDPTLGEKRP